MRGYLRVEILLSSTKENCFDLDNVGGAGWVAVPVRRFGGEKNLLSLSKIKPRIVGFPGRSDFLPTILSRHGSRFQIKLFVYPKSCSDCLYSAQVSSSSSRGKRWGEKCKNILI